MKNPITVLQKFYRASINPLLPTSCPFTPSCSAYMVQAVEKRGLTGFFMGLWRLLRCNPFNKGGFDPVHDNYKGKAKWIL